MYDKFQDKKIDELFTFSFNRKKCHANFNVMICIMKFNKKVICSGIYHENN